MVLFNFNFFPESLSPNVVTLGVKASTCRFGVGKTQLSPEYSTLPLKPDVSLPLSAHH